MVFLKLCIAFCMLGLDQKLKCDVGNCMFMVCSTLQLQTFLLCSILLLLTCRLILKIHQQNSKLNQSKMPIQAYIRIVGYPDTDFSLQEASKQLLLLRSINNTKFDLYETIKQRWWTFIGLKHLKHAYTYNSKKMYTLTFMYTFPWPARVFTFCPVHLKEGATSGTEKTFLSHRRNTRSLA